MKVALNRRQVEFTLSRGDLRGEVASIAGLPAEEITDALVKYDPETNIVTVDKGASKEYALYAALHECICCGPYKGMAPKTTEAKKRCGLIDRMLIKTMPKAERQTYIKKRLEMFEACINYNLNPALNKQFTESIKLLKQVSE
ncbi:hypothetical protein IKF57_00845 [Candidatus Saccharibacteria bacterium]|nr:hypothetical protein [Candidatus Saccharibacteria bacterium]